MLIGGKSFIQQMVNNDLIQKKYSLNFINNNITCKYGLR